MWVKHIKNNTKNNEHTMRVSMDTHHTGHRCGNYAKI